MIDVEAIYEKAYSADMDASLGREPLEAYASALNEVFNAGYHACLLDLREVREDA